LASCYQLLGPANLHSFHEVSAGDSCCLFEGAANCTNYARRRF